MKKAKPLAGDGPPAEEKSGTNPCIASPDGRRSRPQISTNVRTLVNGFTAYIVKLQQRQAPERKSLQRQEQGAKERE
jgi:hypothetical protein